MSTTFPQDLSQRTRTLPAPPAAQEVDTVPLDEAVEQLRTHFKVPKRVVERMLVQESGANPDVGDSPSGAEGMFQVMPGTLDLVARKSGKKLDRNNKLHNAYAGLWLLKNNYDSVRGKAKSERHAWMMAVAGYHGPLENVLKSLDAGGDGIPDQGDGLINTRDHVFNIFTGTKQEDFAQEGPDATQVDEEVERIEVRAEPPKLTPEGGAPSIQGAPVGEGKHVLLRIPILKQDTPRTILRRAHERLAETAGLKGEDRQGFLDEVDGIMAAKGVSGPVRFGTLEAIPEAELEQAPETDFIIEDPDVIAALNRYLTKPSQFDEQFIKGLGTDEAFNPSKTAGERFLEVVGPVASAAGTGVDYLTRPLQAGSAGFWAGARGETTGAFEEMAQTYQSGTPTEKGKNPIAEAARSSETLRSINPRLPSLIGAGAEMTLDPSNLVPLGVAFKGGKLLRGGSRASEVLKGTFLERGFVEPRPLGLDLPGEVGAKLPAGFLDDEIEVVRRAADGRRMLINRKTGDVVDLETGEVVGQGGGGARPVAFGDIAPSAPGGSRSVGAGSARPGGAEQLFDDQYELAGQFLDHARARGYTSNAELTRAGEVFKASARGSTSEQMGALTRALDEHFPPREAATASPSNGGGGVGASAGGGGGTGGVPPSTPPAGGPQPPASAPTPAQGPTLAARAGDLALDLLGTPKGIMASTDLSAPGRQGIVFMMTEPRASSRAARAMFRSFTKKGRAEVLAGIEAHPKFQTAKDSGLFLASFDEGEEVFS